MNTMHRRFAAAYSILWSIFLFCILAGCSTLPKVVPYEDAGACQESTKNIWVVSHGWHTGIIIYANDLNRIIPALERRFFNEYYYEIGWGDSGFYQASDITTGLALRAMFWSPGTVLHVVGFHEPPADHFSGSQVIHLTTTTSGYDNLIRFINASFAKNDNGGVIAQKKGIYGNSQFYSGIGRYHMLNTCNTWTAKALASAGFDIKPAWTLTASGIMKYVKGVQKKQIESAAATK